jgi:DNA-binding transcriptional LysR family regulator
MMLEPRRLLTFRSVAHARSFSRAAAELALTQPAVSQQVRALETQIGARLIERRPGRFALTPVGELLLVHADALADRLRLAERQLGETLSAEQSLLRIGAFPSALATIVPAAVARLHADESHLEVGIVEGTAEQLAPRVRDGTLHVALCFEDAAAAPHAPPDTSRIDLVEEDMLAALPPDHRLARRRRLRLGELAGEPWLASTHDGLIVHACRAAGFEPRLDYLTSDPLAIRALVAAGLAVTLVSRLLAAHLPGIATVDVAGARPARMVYALVPRGTAHPLVPRLLDGLRLEAGAIA